MSVRLWLPGERPVSWNTLKRLHYRRWQERVDAAKQLMRVALADTLGPNPGDWPMFEGPVHISMTAWFDHHPIDATNLPLKLYEDGLIGLIIPDDGYKYVPDASLHTRKAGKGRAPGVEIVIREADDVV